MFYLIGVGSNRGDRAGWIAQAAALLQGESEIPMRIPVQIHAQAPYFDNPAQELGKDQVQGRYLNTAWLVETALGPHQLLHRLQRIETALGRVRTVFHGARSIDLDILLCDQIPVVHNAVLCLPHPAMLERDFVLQPVSAIAGDWLHPIVGQSLATLWRSFKYE